MNFSCDCKKKFVNKQNLARHKRTCGVKKKILCSFELYDGKFICTACEKPYTTKRALYSHINKKRCKPTISKGLNCISKMEEEKNQANSSQNAEIDAISEEKQKENKFHEKIAPKINSHILINEEIKEDSLTYLTKAELDAELSDEITSRMATLVMESEQRIIQALKLMEENLLKVRRLEQLPKELFALKQKIYDSLPGEINCEFREKEADFLCRLENEKTRSNYKTTLNIFLKEIKSAPTLENFKKYFTIFKDKSKIPSAATVSSKRATILAFLKGEFGWSETGTNINLSAFAPPKPCYAPSKKMVGEVIKHCRIAGNDKFAIFVWFAYAIGQRLGDILHANANQINENGILSIYASKTQKFVQKKIPSTLCRFLPLTGDFFADIGGREKVQEAFRKISKEMHLRIPIKAKNLRAAHITAISVLVEAGKTAGSHTHSSTAQASYIDFNAFEQLFDMSEYYIPLTHA